MAIWAEIKKALNTSLGTDEFVPLNERPIHIEKGITNQKKINSMAINYSRYSYGGNYGTVYNCGEDLLINYYYQGSSNDYNRCVRIKLNETDNTSTIITLFDKNTSDSTYTKFISCKQCYYDIYNDIPYLYGGSNVGNDIFYLQGTTQMAISLPRSFYDCFVKLPYVYYTYSNAVFKYNIGTMENIEIRLPSQAKDKCAFYTKKGYWYIPCTNGKVYKLNPIDDSITELINVMFDNSLVNHSMPNPVGRLTGFSYNENTYGYIRMFFDNEKELFCEIPNISIGIQYYYNQCLVKDRHFIEVKENYPAPDTNYYNLYMQGTTIFSKVYGVKQGVYLENCKKIISDSVVTYYDIDSLESKKLNNENIDKNGFYSFNEDNIVTIV